MAGEKATFEWTLRMPDGVPYDLTDDTVDLYVSKGVDRAFHLKKSSLPGAHWNALGGTVRMTLNATSATDVPFARIHQIWWYEIWHTPSSGGADSQPRIVGELNIAPSIRV